MISNSSGVRAPVFQDAVFDADLADIVQLRRDSQDL